jgi:cell division protein ZapE
MRHRPEGSQDYRIRPGAKVHRSPLQRYASLLAQKRIEPDDHQSAAVDALEALWLNLVARPAPPRWRIPAGGARNRVRGLYLWGGVGRGKTWLMDLFFEALPLERKQRFHFHRFMARVHAALKTHPSARDPLALIARDWSRRCRILCLDEFFVSDITDAMLLARLLQALTKRGTVLVATSNAHPEELYRDGLQRSRFLPAIDLLKKHCHVLELAGEKDYRLRILEHAEIYHYPLDANAGDSLADSFERIAAGVTLNKRLAINGRPFTAVRRGDGVVWFSFDELCRKPRSAGDYLEIARSFNTVLLSNVPAMDDASADAARRLVHLVDTLYDRNVKLLVSAAAPPAGLYAGERMALEFQRTASRLAEMQGHDYLARPHLP